MTPMKPTSDTQNKPIAHARETEATQRPVADDGSGVAIEAASSRRRYGLPDLRVGDPTAADPLATRSWSERRELIDNETVSGHGSLYCTPMT